ncbi:hypothetical protein EC23916_2092 [Escherichia coli 2.3916]|nr:hypothetical protein EC23916_2092 [Escherichia coli 2.3916]
MLYLPQLNKHQIQTLATMTAAMFSSTFENSAMALARLMAN